MKKVVLVAATAGFLSALSMGCTWFYMYSHGMADTSGAHFLIRITRYLWPTVFVLMDSDRADIGTIVLFLTSAIANAFIYGFLAFCLWGIWGRLFARNPRPPECG